jgi:phosphatidyl-myo-inositol alpha-mannosyltransferase
VKIGVVCPYALSLYGGVQGQVAGLASTYAAAGHEVTVVAPAANGPVADALRHRGVRVIDAGRTVGIPANGSVAPIALSPAAAVRVRRGLVAAGVEVVHVHEPLAPVAAWGLLLAPLAPMVATFHRSGGGGWLRVLAPVRPLVGRAFAESFAVSPPAATFARLVTSAPTQVLFNGIELPPERASLQRSTSQVAFIGRHEHRKGLEVLLRAHDGLAGVDLVIAGAGPETEDLRARFPETTTRHWLGVIDDDQKRALLSTADVVCLPSLGGESFGVVVLEALAAGAVTVVSAIDGYTQAANGHALLVPPGDPDALRETLAAAAAMATSGTGHGSERARGAARAHATTWSMEALGGKYLEVYQRVIDAHGANSV